MNVFKMVLTFANRGNCTSGNSIYQEGSVHEHRCGGARAVVRRQAVATVGTVCRGVDHGGRGVYRDGREQVGRQRSQQRIQFCQEEALLIRTNSRG